MRGVLFFIIRTLSSERWDPRVDASAELAMWKGNAGSPDEATPHSCDLATHQFMPAFLSDGCVLREPCNFDQYHPKV